VERSLVDVVGEGSAYADALSTTFQSTVWASGIKRKIMTIGNNDHVHDLARCAQKAMGAVWFGSMR